MSETSRPREGYLGQADYPAGTFVPGFDVSLVYLNESVEG